MSKAKRLGVQSRSKRRAGTRGKGPNELYPQRTKYHPRKHK